MRMQLLTSLLCLALLSATSQAAERQRAGSFSTSRGHSGTYQTQVSGERGAGLNRQRSITGANGQTYTHESTSSYDKATSTLSRSVTGSQGNTRSGSITVNPNP